MQYSIIEMPNPLLYAMDPALGRLDYDSLSDQALMEMLISGMEDQEKKEFQDENGNFKDACEWKGFLRKVECESDRVDDIMFLHIKLSDRQFPFEFIPPLVTSFVSSFCEMHGTLHTPHIPRGLIRFEVARANLHGTINFAALPRKLQKLIISFNDFSGSCVLSDLPDTLISFKVSHNNFSGEIALNSLPLALKEIDLSNNNLIGSINIVRLPPSLVTMDLSENSCTGDFRLHSFPESLEILALFDNPLSGMAVLQKADGDMPFELKSNCFSQVVDEEGKRHAWEDEIMCDYY